MPRHLHAHRVAVAALVAGVAFHAGFGAQLGDGGAGWGRGDRVEFGGVEHSR